MNFLAHAWLAGESRSDRVGGMIGDFVKGPLPAGLPPALSDGVRLHRDLDSFAERHPAFRASRARVPAERRRVAGILVDMFYDHFLARYWAEYHAAPLQVFTTDTYRLLEAHAPRLPARFAALLPHIAREDWLASYQDPGTIALALDRMAQRLSRPGLLIGSGVVLQHAYAGFEADFRAFMPAARAFSRQRQAARMLGAEKL